MLPNYIDLTKNLQKMRHFIRKQIPTSSSPSPLTTRFSILIPAFKRNILKLSTKFANIFSDISDNDSNLQYYIVNQPTYKNGKWIISGSKNESISMKN